MTDTVPSIETAVREAIALLSNEKIDDTVKTYKADTEEKKIALEYVNAYLIFIHEVAELDAARGRIRAGYEIRELIGHVNSMLKKKQENLFMKMLLMAPKHYEGMVKK